VWRSKAVMYVTVPYSKVLFSILYFLTSQSEVDFGIALVPIYEKGDKTDCSNYRGMSLLSITYKILSNILLSRLMPYVEEIIGDHQCEI